jgi:hypothetical protein
MKLQAKHTSTYVYVGILILALGLGINAWLKSMNKPVIEEQPENFLDTSLELKKGMTQPEVEELQRILLAKYKANLGNYGANKDGVDGKFGTITENALVKAKGVKTIALKDL